MVSDVASDVASDSDTRTAGRGGFTPPGLTKASESEASRERFNHGFAIRCPHFLQVDSTGSAQNSSIARAK